MLNIAVLPAGLSSGLSAALSPGLGLKCYGSLWLNSQAQPWGEDLCLGVISLQTPQRQVRLGRESEMREWNIGLEMGHNLVNALKSWAIGFCTLTSLRKQPG